MQTGFDFGDIVDEVIELAVGENSTAADVTSARRSIHRLLERWHGLQYNTWRVRTLAVSIAAGVPTVTLPATVDDVLAAMVVQNPGTSTESETPMQRLGDTEYAHLTKKTVSGVPTQFYLRRTEPPTLSVYPTGRAGRVETVKVTYVARPETFDRVSNDIDAPSRWLNALILGAAADLAAKRPERAGPNRATVLKAEYEAVLNEVVQNDRQRKSFKFRMG